MSFEDFKRQALQFPSDEREELADALYDSLDDDEDAPEMESRLPAEVKRRYLAIKEGKTQMLSGEEVFAELLAEPD